MDMERSWGLKAKERGGNKKRARPVDGPIEKGGQRCSGTSLVLVGIHLAGSLITVGDGVFFYTCIRGDRVVISTCALVQRCRGTEEPLSMHPSIFRSSYCTVQQVRASQQIRMLLPAATQRQCSGMRASKRNRAWHRPISY